MLFSNLCLHCAGAAGRQQGADSWVHDSKLRVELTGGGGESSSSHVISFCNEVNLMTLMDTANLLMETAV